MNKTVVINVVGLTERLIGDHTPFLKKWISGRNKSIIKPVLPAVTCSAQTTYLTGKLPTDHGIVGNGWYFKDECEIKFWKQSNKLIQADKIWDFAKKTDPNFTCANICWWYNMYSSVDFSVTPRPMYPADGRKIPDCYTYPMELRDLLQKKLGQFPLFEFWGPRTTIRSTKWIAEASKIVDELHNPTLSFIYLPHLDYGLQKHGLDFSKIGKDLEEIDWVCEGLIRFYEKKRAKVILISEYGITDVDNPIHINRILRENGLIKIKEEMGLEQLDAGASDAFAVADHQVAHVYLNKKEKLDYVKNLLLKVNGIAKVITGPDKEKAGINHDRAGDLIIVADKRSWFTYYYWLDDKKAPDFARTVDIHRKPGYDPVELFTNPEINLLPLKLGWILGKKKVGFRTLMDIIPLDANLVKGSHGNIPENKSDWPLLIGQKTPTESVINPENVCQILLKEVLS